MPTPTPEPGQCFCKGGGFPPFKAYAKAGEHTTSVTWPENELVKCTENLSPETRSISPAGAKPGGQFQVRSQQHVIKYRYGYKNNHGENVYFDCFVRFTVEGRWISLDFRFRFRFRFIKNYLNCSSKTN